MNITDRLCYVAQSLNKNGIALKLLVLFLLIEIHFDSHFMPNKYPKKEGRNVPSQNYQLTNGGRVAGQQITLWLTLVFQIFIFISKTISGAIFLLLFGIAIGIIYECAVPIIFKWLFDSILPQKMFIYSLLRWPYWAPLL